MRKMTVVWAAGVGLVSLGIAVANLRAAEDAQTNAAINSIADQLEKGDSANAKKAAKALADKNDTDVIMDGFKLRAKKGIGVGAQAGVAVPDGIEAKIESIARDGITADALKKEGAALTRTGFVIAAVGHTALAKAPAKDLPKMKRSDWIQWAEGLTKSAEEFTAAAKANNAGDVKKAASKIKQNCDSCHAVFK